MSLFERILIARGLTGTDRNEFLDPSYEKSHDPFLLPDMALAVERLVDALKRDEHITIYGDYDIDGLTASTLLHEAFEAFGFTRIDTFIPNRFVEGYGMTEDAVERIAATGSTLVVTVDCGSLSEGPIKHAKTLGVDVIVTDHHNVALTQPPAVAVINPKRLLQDHPDEYDNYVLKKSSKKNLYPFVDLPGVGVAFKLVQALQIQLNGMPVGQEKWLLDLVALGTVCDVVTLVDENRTHVYWGLKVLTKTRRPGIRALMAVSGVEPEKVNARSLGFALGPRMNAAGRLETALYAQELLLTKDTKVAMDRAQLLDEMNIARRSEQDHIYSMAMEQAELYTDHPVLVVSHASWNHGIVGIVAAKLLEKYKKPAFVLQEMGEESKGSARSYGDFSAADSIRYADDIIAKGGGHKLAAGVTLPTANIQAFRERVNKYFISLKLPPQPPLLLPREDISIDDFSELTEQFATDIAQLEPFGHGNPEPTLRVDGVLVRGVRIMGANGQHIKLDVQDSAGRSLQVLAFSAPDEWFVEPGARVKVWFQVTINEWRGRREVEGRLVHLEIM